MFIIDSDEWGKLYVTLYDKKFWLYGGRYVHDIKKEDGTYSFLMRDKNWHKVTFDGKKICADHFHFYLYDKWSDVIPLYNKCLTKTLLNTPHDCTFATNRGVAAMFDNDYITTMHNGEIIKINKITGARDGKVKTFPIPKLKENMYLENLMSWKIDCFGLLNITPTCGFTMRIELGEGAVVKQFSEAILVINDSIYVGKRSNCMYIENIVELTPMDDGKLGQISTFYGTFKALEVTQNIGVFDIYNTQITKHLTRWEGIEIGDMIKPSGSKTKLAYVVE